MRGVRFPDINVRFSDDPLPTTSQQEKSSILHDKLYEVANLDIFVHEMCAKLIIYNLSNIFTSYLLYFFRKTSRFEKRSKTLLTAIVIGYLPN